MYWHFNSGGACHCIQDGVHVKHFMEIIPLKRADAAAIYSTLVDYFKQKYPVQ